MIKVISLSYIIEDGMWMMSNEDGGEFKWWNYLVGEDRDVIRNYEFDECSVRGMIKDWESDCRLENSDRDELSGYEKSKEEFVECIKDMNKDKDMGFYNVSVINWSVEYDVNISLVISDMS